MKNNLLLALTFGLFASIFAQETIEFKITNPTFNNKKVTLASAVINAKIENCIAAWQAAEIDLRKGMFENFSTDPIKYRAIYHPDSSFNPYTITFLKGVTTSVNLVFDVEKINSKDDDLISKIITNILSYPEEVVAPMEDEKQKIADPNEVVRDYKQGLEDETIAKKAQEDAKLKAEKQKQEAEYNLAKDKENAKKLEEKNSADTEKTKKDAEKATNDAEKSVKEAEASAAQEKAKNTKDVEKKKAKLNKALDKTTTQIANTNTDLGKAQQEWDLFNVDAKNEIIKSKGKEVKSNVKSIGNYASKIEKLNSKSVEFTTNIATLKESDTRITAEQQRAAAIPELQKEAKSMLEKMKDIKKEYTKLESKLAENNTEIAALKSKSDELIVKNTSLNKDIVNIKSEISSFNPKAKKKALKKLTKKSKGLLKDKTKITEKLAKLSI